MALINCPECNEKVSENATTCPHCGYNLNDSPAMSTLNKVAIIIIIGMIILQIIKWFSL